MRNLAVHREVVRLLAEEPRDRGTVLDVSCGRGEVLKLLRELGFEVRGTNLDKYDADYEGIPVDDGVDLLRRLPYDDEKFFGVVLQEVWIRLENQRHALSELCRLVAPGGVLVLTAPNIFRLNSRLSFFLTGFHKTKRKLMPASRPLEASYKFHNHPWDFHYLLLQLYKYGMTVERVGRGRRKLRSWLLFPLVWPLLAPLQWAALFRRTRLDAETRAFHRYVLRLMVSPSFLMDENLILKIRKHREPFSFASAS